MIDNNRNVQASKSKRPLIHITGSENAGNNPNNNAPNDDSRIDTLNSRKSHKTNSALMQ